MQKKNYLSVLNVLSCFAVICLHVNGDFWRFAPTRSWAWANIIESVFYFAVPVFLMISGATLLDYKKKYSTKVFFKKRFTRTFIPFVFWSLISFLFIFVFQHQRIQSMTFKDFINRLLLTQFNEFFWYFPILFSVYLSIPLFASIDERYKKNILCYLIFVTFLFNIVGVFIQNIFDIQISNYSVAAMSGYLFFTITGYYIAEYEINFKKRQFIYIVGIIGLLMHAIGTYYFSVSKNVIVSSFKGYLNLPSVLYAVAIFTVLRYLKIPEFIVNIAVLFEKQAFGIYLVHYFILHILYLIKFPMHTLSEKIYAVLIVFIVSWLIVKILQKIPLIKHMV